MLEDTKKLLTEREETHGDFKQTALTSQHLKDTLRRTPGWEELDAQHSEALEMIGLKIARIVSGDARHKDSWEDIIGYATLALKSIKE